jgi:hypothetical protein
MAEAILSKKNNAGDIAIPDFKLYYRTIVNKQKQLWCTHREKTHTSVE